MERIEFLAGTEKRFAQFISELNDKDKIALISHTDLDGLTAARVTNEIIDADIVKFLGYSDLNKNLIQFLKEKNVKFVIFTDLFIKDTEMVREIEKFARILIIDHHLFEIDLNSEKTVFLNSQGYCAAYICYYLFSKVKDIEYLDWLVACACVADWQYTKNQTWMHGVYSKYDDNFSPTIEGIKNSKKFWELQLKISYSLVYFKEEVKKVYDKIGINFGDIGDLGKYYQIIKAEIDIALQRFVKEKIA